MAYYTGRAGLMSLVPLQMLVASEIAANPANSASPGSKKRKRRVQISLRAKIRRTKTRIRAASWASLALARRTRRRRRSARKSSRRGRTGPACKIGSSLNNTAR